MNILSDKEYIALQKRVADGKRYLFDKWASKEFDDLEDINLWRSLSNQLLEQMKLRGLFDQQKELPKGRLLGETGDEYVERMQAKLIIERKLTGTWTKLFMKNYQKKKGEKERTQVQLFSSAKS